MDELDNWLKEMSEFKLPRYANLPDLELYRDQLLSLVQQYVSPVWIGDNPIVTTSMVNNYVKNGMMPAPVKKRYQRDQVAYLIVITFLKQVMSMDEIKKGIQSETIALKSVESAYDTFCDKQEAALKNLSDFSEKTPSDTSSLSSLVIDMVTRTFATKLMTRKILTIGDSDNEKKKGD